MARTDPFPVMTEDYQPLGGMWWLDGSEMVVELDGRQARARFAPYAWGNLWMLARRLLSELQAAAL